MACVNYCTSSPWSVPDGEELVDRVRHASERRPQALDAGTYFR